ncbi:MAG: DUF4276 family protein [Prolixibacteraceae bacterium]|jgi:hypothetical protein|nr:DUF4276 family protein [Prolixibacteraceae bacterium]
MTRQIFVGLMTEGTTDNRFLESIVKKTFDEIGYECNGDVETYVSYISIDKTGLGFVDQVLTSSKKGVEEFGIMILCVHSDADDINDLKTIQNKIIPAITEIDKKDEGEYCKVITAIIPVQMIEAWMLADKELLKIEIGTNKSDNDLNINRLPEEIANPKILIEEAIRIAREELTKRKRKDLTIKELYLPIGQKLTIEKLDTLPSYLKFKDAIREAYRRLNYLT